MKFLRVLVFEGSEEIHPRENTVHHSENENIRKKLKMSKKECINSQRLEKLFTSNRDLTLSSNKKKNSQATENKKANRSRDFIPNLINPRIRAENVNTDIKKEETVKQKRNNKEKEDRFALKRGNNLIQTIGVFSEGIAAVSRQQRKYANGTYCYYL